VRSMVFKNLAAHRRRNQMTTLIYSLSLGFVLFLSISCRMQINVSSMEQLKQHASYFVVLSKGSNSLHVQTLEQIMLMNNHIIEEFSWVTTPLNGYDKSHVQKTTINDYANRGEHPNEVHGVMPNYFTTTIKEFSTEMSSNDMRE